MFDPLHPVLAAFPDIVLVVDSQGCVLACNAHQELLLPPAELVGKRIDDVLPPALTQTCSAHINEVLRERQPVLFEYELALPNGVEHFEARLSYVEDQKVVVVIRNISEQVNVRKDLEQARKLSDAITRAQTHFIQAPERRQAFDGLLDDCLALTGSEYGFIGEVLSTPDGSAYLKTYAITDIAWDAETKALFDARVADGLKFYNLNTLFGYAIKNRQVVIANAPATDLRAGGLPPGHPPLHRFLGMPIFHSDQMVGVLGVANRASDYDEQLVAFLRPLLLTLGRLIVAAWQQQEWQASRRFMEAILENMPSAVFLKDAKDLRFRYFNRAGERMLGKSRDQLIGLSDYDLFPQQQADLFVANDRDALAQDGVLDTDGEAVTTLLGVRVVRTQKLALRDDSGKPEFLLGIADDITDRRQAERLKDEFVAMVSHELRTPLTSITGALGLLNGGMMGEMSPQAQQLFSIANRNCHRLTSLINDLLDMEKINVGQMTFECCWYSLHSLIEQGLESILNYTGNLEVAVDPECQVESWEIYTDRLRFIQVLSNYLSNAVKFTPSGSCVEIVLEPDGEQLWVGVRDDGPGVAPEFKEKLFERFEQADTTSTRSHGGTGLGLAISRAFAEGMGGRVRCDSEVGQGATFWIGQRARRIQHGDRHTPVQMPVRGRVLVVEDEPDVAFLLRSLLTQDGFDVVVTASGSGALKALSEQPFDVMTLDWMLPDLKGRDVIRYLRQKLLLSDLPIVVISARPDLQKQQWRITDHHMYWLAKPIDWLQLSRILSDVVGR